MKRVPPEPPKNGSLSASGATSTLSLMETRLSTQVPWRARRAVLSCCAPLGPAYRRMARLVIAAILGSLCAVHGVPAAAQTEIVMLTGNTGGVYYPLGIALAKIWERTMPGTRVSVRATQASVENFNLLQQRRGTFALGQGDVMSDAFKGNAEAGFPSSRDRLRMVAALFPNYLHLVALKSAKVRSVLDLKAKRVSVGASRSGNELNARVLLGAAGMASADLRPADRLPSHDGGALASDPGYCDACRGRSLVPGSGHSAWTMDLCLAWVLGAALVRLPSPVTLGWEHSVEHVTIEEEWEAVEGRLVLRETRVGGPGAGI